jgi:uncharacterized protein (DUF305 family)
MDRRRFLPPILPFLAGAALLAGCAASGYGEGAAPTSPPADQTRAGSSTVQPGPPGSPGRHLSPDEVRHRHELPHTRADVVFMQNMIHHHAQALVMSGLAPERAGSDEMRLLAERIHRSQTDEIALMQRWLRERDEEAPEVDMTGGVDHSAHGQHRHHAPPAAHDEHELMAGMLTPDQLGELAAARGAEFDRLFLEFMIFHHEGAILMVEELFSVPGAAQDSEIYQFASHVDADQRIEIGRMHWMLEQGR